MAVVDKPALNITLVRIVPSFNEYGGGLNTDVKELSIRMNPLIRRQIIIAPFDSNYCTYDEHFDFEIIRIKNPCIRYVPFFSFIINQLIYSIFVYKKLRAIPNVGLIQSHGFNLTMMSCIVGKLLHIPVVGMLHGTLEAYSTAAGTEETILATLIRPTHAIIIDSGTRAPEKFKRIWGERTTVVTHGIDTNVFYPKEKNLSLLKKLNIEESDLVILSISSLHPIKNVDLAIDAYKNVLNNKPESRTFLLIAGDGNQREELIKDVNSRGLDGHIKFIGHIKNSEIAEYISIADICVGTSLKDNMNRSILEPMACGKPIVAFGGGNIENFIFDGHNGYLAKRGDVLDFSKKLEILLSDPKLRSDIGTHAYQTIQQKRSWTTRIEHDVAVYKEVIKSCKWK